MSSPIEKTAVNQAVEDTPPRDKTDADEKPAIVDAPKGVETAAQPPPAELQLAVAEIGERLERQRDDATKTAVELQERLRDLAQRMAQTERETTEKLAAAEQAIAQARAEANAAVASENGPVALGESSDAPEKQVAAVSEVRVAVAPPPAPVAGESPQLEPAAPVAAAPQAMPVAPATVAQAIPAQPAAATTRGDLAWEQTVFGAELAANRALAADRAELIEGMLSGDDTAAALAGQLLIFNAASAERMPQLLKDVGEAYYAWRPHTSGGDDPLRDALIAYLASRCEAVGVFNSIELVRPGDRFDQKKHNSKHRGGEIDGVFGWVVLRDNGNVYTKASVAAK